MAGFAAALTTTATLSITKHFGLRLGLVDLRMAREGNLATLLGAVWIGAITGDFFFYWFHRALHKTPFLWAHHLDALGQFCCLELVA